MMDMQNKNNIRNDKDMHNSQNCDSRSDRATQKTDQRSSSNNNKDMRTNNPSNCNQSNNSR